MARLEPKAFLEKLAKDLLDRREGYFHDLSNRLDRDPDSLSTKKAASLNGRYRECEEILEMVKAGLARMA